MRKLFISIIAVFPALFVSCNKSMESTVLDMKMEVVTPVVNDGGTFTFRIRTNQDAFTVKSASCEFKNEDVLSVGAKYSPTNGSCVFTFENVAVSEDHNSAVVIRVRDDKTGAEKTLTGHFLCQLFDAGLIVLTESVKEKDSLRFLVTSNHSSFKIESWSSTAKLAGNFQKDSTYLCEDGGRLFAARVNGYDSGTSPQTLTMTLHDPYLDKSVTLTGEFNVIPKN